MNQISLNRLKFLMVSVSCLAVSIPASAQVDEIIVTARKRSENMQNVPGAVSAYSAAQLQNAGVENLADVQGLTPNVTLQENGSLSPGSIQVAIRGIGNDPGFDAGVGIYVDDVYLNRAAGALLDVYDVERIEVLKGPQGNLYGRNTIGGAVKYISREPGPVSRANIELKTGTDNLIKLRAGASGEIGDGFYAGIGISYANRDGYQTNLFNGEDYAGEDRLALRGTAIWEPSDQLTLKLVGDYAKDTSNPILPVRIAANLGGSAGLNAFNGLLLGADNFIPGSAFYSGQPLDTALPTDIDVVNTEHTTGGYDDFEIESKSLAFTAKYDVNDQWSFKSISAGRWLDNTLPIDFDGTDQLFINSFQDRDQFDFSQELQVNFTGDRLNGVFGAYYLNGDRGSQNLAVQSPRLRLLTSHVKNVSVDDRDLESYSLYSNFDWDFTDRLQLSLGGRYTKDKKTLNQIASVTATHHVAVLVDVAFGTAGSPVIAPFPINPAYSTAYQFAPFPPGLVVGFFPHFSLADGSFLGLGTEETVETYSENKTGSDSWSEFSPTAKIAYQASDDVLLYAGFSSGFKSGGFNTTGRSPLAISFDPETVNTYSAGIKSTMADGTLRVNAEAFFNDYQDKQLATIAFNQTTNSLVQTTDNVGEVESKGFEIETTWQPTDAFIVNANVGYLDAEIKQFTEYQNVGGNNVPVNVADDYRLGFSPKWTGQARAQYTFDLQNSGDVTLSGSAAYRSKSYTNSPVDITDPFKLQQVSEAHTLLNAGLTYRSESGRWRASLEGKNLSDKRILTNTFNVSNFITGSYTRGRTWTATLGYEFD